MKPSFELPVITSDKYYTENKLHPQGLISQQIFGPIKSYKCECGKFSSKNLHENITCDVCNVDVIHNDSRYKRFAKIQLNHLIILTQKKKSITKFFKTKFKFIIDPTYQKDMLAKDTHFLKKKKNTYEIVKSFSESCAPILITGNFSLYLAFYYFDDNEILNHFTNEVLVTPPDTRKLLFKNNKYFSDPIDSHYLTFLRLTNSELKSNTQTSINLLEEYKNLIKNTVAYIDDDLIKTVLDKKSAILQYEYDQLYNTVFNKICKKSGMIRYNFLGKTIDFSARAVVVCDPSLKPFEIKIPKKMFFKLFSIEYYAYFYKFHREEFLKECTTITDILEIKNTKYFNEFLEFAFKKPICVLINRQPTLWRYGMPAVQIKAINNSNVISVSPIFVEAPNMDFDGDTAAIYKIHDKTANQELFNNAFIKNNVKYDHNPDFIQTILNESFYTFQLLFNYNPIFIFNPIEINSIADVSYKFNQHLQTPVIFDNLTYSLGFILIHKLLNINFILNVKNPSKQQISEVIFSNHPNNYFDILTNLHKSLNWIISTYQYENITIPVDDVIDFIKSESKEKILLKKLPKNPMIGYQLYEALSDNIYNSLKNTSKLYKLRVTRFKNTQFTKSLVSIGYLANSKNQVINEPIKNSIFEGLPEKIWFNTSYGSRKGIVDKIKAVPESGHAQRNFVINLSPIEIVQDNCNSTNYFKIPFTNPQSLINRYFFNIHSNQIELLTQEKIKSFSDEFIYLRSPITCITPNFKICKKCFGEYPIKSNFVGIMAGQYLEERLFQSSMSSFHFSGAAFLNKFQNIIKFIQNHLIDIVKSDGYTTLLFDTAIPDFVNKDFLSEPKFKIKDINELSVSFYDYNNFDILDNEDAAKAVNSIKKILLSKKHNIPEINETYLDLTQHFFKFSNIYSSYIELLLTNNHLTENNLIHRYDPSSKIIKRLNIKQLHSIISPTLSWIFEPNAVTAQKLIADLKNKKSFEDLTIYEKIYFGII